MRTQESEASLFYGQHHAEILRVRDEVLAAAERFMAKPELAAILPQDVQATMKAAIQSKCPEQVGYSVRSCASAFVRAGLSSAFWLIVDATNFWSDAVGATWRYMAQARRSQSLTWAAEMAAHI